MVAMAYKPDDDDYPEMLPAPADPGGWPPPDRPDDGLMQTRMEPGGVDPSADPFAEIGGGRQRPNGDWVPMDYPDQEPAAPEGAFPEPGAGAPAQSGDPFAEIGGGVQLPNGDWVPIGHPYAAGATGAPSDEGAPGGPGAPTVASVNDAFRTRLFELLGDNPNAVSLDDPALKSQMDAYRIGQQRSLERQRASAAERYAAQGLGSSGMLDVDIEGAQQQAGEAEASYGAGLVGKERVARREQLQNMLQTASEYLTDQDKLRLTDEIARLDAEIRREGISEGSRQFFAGLSQADRQFIEGLSQADQHFLKDLLYRYDVLGYDIGKTEADLNRDALLGLL